MVGDELFDFCVKRENRQVFHPELRAEVDFGLENSDREDLDELLDLVDLFMRRSHEWANAEIDIAKRRDEMAVPPPSYVSILREVASLEVEYQYSMWKEDYGTALLNVTTIVDKLSGDELSGYRALWNYFAGCAAYYLWITTKQEELLRKATERFRRASLSTRTISWFMRLSNTLDFQQPSEPTASDLTVSAVASINSYLINLGMVGSKFDRIMKDLHAKIQASTADMFDKALTELGRMLGFSAERPQNTGAPDSVWKLGSQMVLLFESKSEESPSGSISISTCRQAQGHQAWLKANPFFTQSAELLTIVVSPREYLDKDAIPHAQGLFYLHTSDVQKLFAEADSCLRIIRSKLTDLETEQRLDLIHTEISVAKLMPAEVISRLTKVRLADLQTR